VIEDAYNFLNHNRKKKSQNTTLVAANALTQLYVYLELFEKNFNEMEYEDVITLIDFLKGVSASDNDIVYKFKSNRSNKTINEIISVYREYVKFLGLRNHILLEHVNCAGLSVDFEKNAWTLRTDNKATLPKFISVEEYNEILKWIRTNIEDKERRLRDECIVRIMFELGCRLGEVLGSTVEDYCVSTYQNNGEEHETGMFYIRNRFTDKKYQCAKMVMKINNRLSYHSKEYNTFKVGYEVAPFKMELYELIMEYIDLAHVNANKKFPKNYKSSEADAVGEYKQGDIKNHYVFLNRYGSAITAEGWNKELRMIFDGVGIQRDEKCRKDNLSHRFRHGFIMNLKYNKGLRNEDIMLLSRHRSTKGFSAYDNPSLEQIAAIKENIELRILDDLSNEK